MEVIPMVEKEQKIRKPREKKDFNSLQMKYYNELLEMKKKVDQELKPLKKYLEAVGLLKREERKKKA